MKLPNYIDNTKKQKRNWICKIANITIWELTKATKMKK